MAATEAPATNPALQQLADIQEPALLNDWYMAPIWWLLLLLTIVLAVLAFRFYRRRQLRLAPRRFAQASLATISLEDKDAAHQITALLKRFLLTEAPSHPALAYSGNAWQQFLMQSLSAQPQSTQPPLPDLLALHYQQQPDAGQLELYAHFARLWLQQAKITTAAPAVKGGDAHV